MKGGRIAGILLLALVSCERNGELHPGEQTAGIGGEGLVSTGEGPGEKTESPPEKTPGKEGDAVLVEKKPPVAEVAPGQPGKVISPFNGELIDVSGIPAGSLVADPTYPPEAKKHFRVPEAAEEPVVKPPTILDPSTLIRPREAPKDNGGSEP